MFNIWTSLARNSISTAKRTHLSIRDRVSVIPTPPTQWKLASNHENAVFLTEFRSAWLVKAKVRVMWACYIYRPPEHPAGKAFLFIRFLGRSVSGWTSSIGAVGIITKSLCHQMPLCSLFSLLKTPRNASARHAKGPIPLGNTSLVTLSVSTCIRGVFKGFIAHIRGLLTISLTGQRSLLLSPSPKPFSFKSYLHKNLCPELSLSFAELSTSFGQRQCGTLYPRASRSRAELGCRKSARGISASAFASRQLSFFQLCFYVQYLVSRLSAWSRTVRSSALLLFIYSFARGAACRQRTLSRLPLVMLFYVPCFGI